jgi:hypothetical protein
MKQTSKMYLNLSKYLSNNVKILVHKLKIKSSYNYLDNLTLIIKWHRLELFNL